MISSKESSSFKMDKFFLKKKKKKRLVLLLAISTRKNSDTKEQLLDTVILNILSWKRLR